MRKRHGKENVRLSLERVASKASGFDVFELICILHVMIYVLNDDETWPNHSYLAILTHILPVETTVPYLEPLNGELDVFKDSSFTSKYEIFSENTFTGRGHT